MPRTSGGVPRYAEKSLGDSAKSKSNQLTLLFAGKPQGQAVEIRADADIYYGKLDAGHSLKFSAITGRGQWLHVVSGDVSLENEHLTSGDGVAIENARTLEIKSGTAAEFLLFDLS
jgi:quercetin 2,3-dioxygenase